MKNAHSLIVIRDLTRSYVLESGVTTALNGVSFSVETGEFLALMGPSGSGKSTLMHLMGFLDQPTSGRYFFDNKDVSGFSEEELAALRREEVGFVFQAFHLLPKSTVLDNVLLPLTYSTLSSTTRLSKAKHAIDAVGLSHRASHTSGQRAGGERQRVAIARALVNDPRILFADEPTGNLDTKSGSEVLELLQDLHRQGHTVVMVTHETEAAEYAGRILRLRDGTLISDEPNLHIRRGGYSK